MPDIPRVFLDIGSLLNNRRIDLTRIFSRISVKRERINFVSTSLGGKIICGFNDGIEFGSEFKNWRFKTISPEINANYHEIWSPHQRNQYFLIRAYLNLFKKNELSETEYIHLHCDASEPDNTPHAIYKKSLHIHVEAADHPIPKAHIALYNGRPEILDNIRTFNQALNESVIMIESQVIEKFLVV